MINWKLDYKPIDFHTHMGLEYCLYYTDHDADGMVRAMDDCGVDFVVCSPCEDLFGGGEVGGEIIRAMKKYPDRFKGYYCVNPVVGYDVEQIKKVFRENPGFVGLKFLPDYHRTALTDPIYAPALELANEYHMLILSHTWGVSMNGESCNSADKVIGVLERYPNITFIMGHSIQGQVDDAIAIAKKYPNAYLDLCDTCRLNGVVEKMVREVGAKQVIWGTDAPMQTHNFQMGCVIGAKITDEEKKLILRDNALRILSSVGRPQ